MTAPSVTPPERRLRGILQELLSNASGEPVVIDSLTRRGSDFEKRTPVETVSATLATGERVELFVKHLGFQIHPYRRDDREVRVYEDLFSGAGLPVVKYYGSTATDADGQRLLVLEHIEAQRLYYEGLDAWLAAARRLADLHGHFATRRNELLRADFLLRIDGEYLSAWAERAVAVITDGYSGELARRLERMTAAWQRVVDRIVSQPVTLVHNHLSPKNALVSQAAELPARICFVDWEMAGLGCALEDLVHMRYQRLPAAADRRVVNEYVRSLAGTGLLPANRRELRELLAACELQRTVYKLGQSRRSNRTIEHVARRITYAERLWSRLRTPVRAGSA